MNEKEVILEVRDLTVGYGGISAVKGISFSVREGEIITLIGANGAGKTSTLHAISGITPYKGEILYRGQSLQKIPADRIVGLGIAQVPEGRGIFGNLTVMDNLIISTWQRKDRDSIEKDIDHIFELFPRLRERKKQLGGTLSGGEQQMLALGRALMSKGQLLLLDEPSMGLSPLLTQEILKILERINKEGTTILIVEQNMRIALRIASFGYVLETGAIIASGASQELLDNPLVKEAYLGG
jgi:branched-chain amino acid transport system ATP-binding protein